MSDCAWQAVGAAQDPQPTAGSGGKLQFTTASGLAAGRYRIQLWLQQSFLVNGALATVQSGEAYSAGTNAASRDGVIGIGAPGELSWVGGGFRCPACPAQPVLRCCCSVW